MLSKRYKVLAILFILLSGFGLRAYKLGFQSLWNDEILTYTISSLQPTEILTDSTVGRNFPPLYYLIVNFFLKFGSQESLLRFPSFLFGSLCIPLFYLILRKWHGERVGLMGAIIMTISPFHVWYSQEARPYALLLFLSLLSIWLLQMLMMRPNKLWLQLGFVSSTAATFYSHYLALAFICFVCTYVLLNFSRQAWRYRLALCGGIVLLMAPAIYRIIVFMPNRSANPFAAFNPISIAYVIWSFGTGYSLGPTLTELHLPNHMSIVLSYFPMITLIMLFFSLLFLFGAFRLWQTDRLSFVSAGLWFLFPLALAVLGAIFTPHPFNVRYSILSFPPFILFIALGVNSLKKKWRQTSILVLICIMSLFVLQNYFFNEKYHRDDNRAAGQFLSAHALPNDLVIASAAYTSANLRYYYQGMPVKIVGYPQKKNQIETGARFVKPSRVETDLKAILGERERFWLFLSRTYHSDPHGYIRNYCDVHFIRERELKGSGVDLVLYKRRVNNNSQFISRRHRSSLHPSSMPYR